jgi:photosystem II stability/assembly factor-like uncharacterized protein
MHELKNYGFVLLLLTTMIIVSCPGKNVVTEEAEGEKIWTVLGPGGGGGVMKPTVSPFNEDLVLTHCDMTATYLSHNGGKSWKMKNLWNVPDDFEFDPVDSNTVYAATRGFIHSEDRGSGISLLLKSENSGEKWRIIYPEVTKIKQVEMLQSTSLMPSSIIEGAIDGTIQKVKVHPTDNRKIYLGIAPLIDYMQWEERSQNKSVLVMSSDHGTTWRKVTEFPGGRVMAIFPDKNEERVIVFTELYCLHIYEATGRMESFPLPSSNIIAVEGGDVRKGLLIYIQAPFTKDGMGGMYISEDEGRNWTQINNGLREDIGKDVYPSFKQGLAVCESAARVAYISLTMPRQQKGDSTYGPVYSVYKTENSGAKWMPVLLSSSAGYISANYSSSWMEESYGPGWGGSPIEMGVAPDNPDVCYAGDNGRGYRTVDGGRTWEQIYSRNNPDGSYSSNGLDVTTCYGIHFNPFDRDHYFICYTDIGLFHTFNGGESWHHSISGIPNKWVNTCYDVEFDPFREGKVWSVWGNAHDLPRAKMFGDNGFGGFQGGVAMSEDAGRTWHKANAGMPDNSVCTNILLQRDSPADVGILYVSVFERGIYRSVDGGLTWQISNTGLGKNLFAWQLKQDRNGRLFALFSRGLSKGQVVDGLVYFSDDKAASWKQLVLPDSVNGPHDLLIDPDNPDKLYLSCWPRTVSGKDVKGGVLRSSDGGDTWMQVFDERVRVNSANIDPEHHDVIYINTFHNSAYRSEDSGDTWKRLEGYRFKWGQQVFPDINNPGNLFLTTFGGSVFYGPATGVPGSEDDIVNMPEGWW